MLANIPAWLLYVGIALFLVIGVVLFVLGSRGAEEEDEEDEEREGGLDGDRTQTLADGDKTQALIAGTDEHRARKSRMIALKASFESSLQTTGAGVQMSSKDRLTMPWFMLVGADGSGKKSLLANTGLSLPFGPPFEVDSTHRDAGRWWLFEDAVVLEAPPATAAGPAPTDTTLGGTMSDSQKLRDSGQGWTNLLHLLRRERPDSPLNGIIVTVSCADLVGSRRKSPEEVGEQADRIRMFLERARRMLGVRLPIHLLVTKCDVLPGFKSFAASVPEGRRNDMFGWVNSSRLEASFQLAWIEDGFKALRRSLGDLHDELLAATQELDTHHADGLFVFMNEFADIQESLKDFVARLIPMDERRPSLFFRGMYFTGDTLDHAAHAASAPEMTSGATMQLSAEIALDEPEAHNLVFLKSLFADKIFKEAGLARPVARFRPARDRRVVAAQAAAVVLTMLGGFGLWASVSGFQRGQKVYRTGLRNDAATLTQVLGGIAIDLDELKRASAAGADTGMEARTRDAAVIELVSELRDIAPIRMRSVFVPSSWFSPVPGDVDKAMTAGVKDFVLPVIRQRLQERVDRLLNPHVDPSSVAVSDTLDPADPRSLVAYLNDVRVLSVNIARYNALASPNSGTVGDLSALLDYLFAERPLADTTAINPAFKRMLRAATAPRINVSASVVRAVVARCLGIVASVADSASRNLSPGARVATPESDWLALRHLDELAQLSDPKKGLVAAVTDSAILGVKLARIIQDSIVAQLRVAATRVARDTTTPDRAQRLVVALNGLAQLPFMAKAGDREAGSELLPGQRLRWDVGSLALALDLRNEITPGMLIVADEFSPALRDRMHRAFEMQVRARAIDVAAGAERFTPVKSDSLDPHAEATAQIADLDEASAPILKLAAMLDSMKAGPAGKNLVTAATRQAEQVLALAQIVFDKQQFLLPQTMSIAAWQGVIPIGFAAFGTKDSLAFNQSEQQQLGPLRGLVHEVEPALHFLEQTAVKSDIREPRLVAFWTALDASIVKAEQKDATSTFFALDRFVHQTMSATDQRSCENAITKRDTTALPHDFFTRRRSQFLAAMVSRCVGSPTAVAEYKTLRSTFLSKLAGRYPFVDSAGASKAPDADPAAIRDFFHLFDGLMVTGDVALRTDPRLGATARPAIAFLEQVGRVRPFFAAFVDSGTAQRGPEYSVLIVRQAPAGKDTTTGPDRILKIGDRSIAIEDSSHAESWRYGEPIKVVRLTDDASVAQPVFSSVGGWSLLRLAGDQRRAGVVVQIFDPDTKILLGVPAFPYSVPDIVPKGK